MNNTLQGLRLSGLLDRLGLASLARGALARRGYVTYRVDWMPLHRAMNRSAPEARRGRRASSRLQSGKLLNLERELICECAVINRSPGGLRIAIAPNSNVPMTFYFFDDRDAVLRRASIAWRRGGMIGARLGPASDDRADAALIASLRNRYYAASRGPRR